MKKIVYRRQLNSEESDAVKRIAERFSLTEESATVLYTRGVTSEEDVQKYLNAGADNFIDPYTLRNMDVVTSRIKEAAKNGETVVVYGDYDADGVCATTIMVKTLRHLGIEVFPVIPEREAGYGLSEVMIEEISGYYPDLLITVDCGISNREEVELLKDIGIDVIVTDHHELPEVLPDAPILNPKLQQEYPYDNLCGAGVAFKIACALTGEWAYSLVDYACVATVADSMTLVGENRDIVAEGLKAIASGNAAEPLKLLLSGCRETNETAIAFTLAPRLNAAGRMGDVSSALGLFLTEDAEEMQQYADRLVNYNAERQTECETMYQTAKRLLQKKGAFSPSIVLFDPEWKAGFLGIVASRLSEEYARPTFLFCEKEDGILKGSARSIEGVNIYEVLNAVADKTEQFGGHAQAAGVSVEKARISEFEDAVNAYLDENLPETAYEPTVFCEKLLDKPFTIEQAKDLMRLEPFGMGNRRPLYAVECKGLSSRVLKSGSTHLSVTACNMEMLYFGGEKYRAVLDSPVTKYLVFEPNVSVFNRKESFKGYLRDFITDMQYEEEQELCFFHNNLMRVAEDENAPLPDTVSDGELENALTNALSGRYGTLVLSSHFKRILDFPVLQNLPKYLFINNYNNLYNCCVVSPSSALDTSEYHTVVYLDKPLVYTGKFRGQNVVMSEKTVGINVLRNLSVERAIFSSVYSVIRNAGRIEASDSVSLYEKIGQDFDPYQFIFCVDCFWELGLLESFGGTFSVTQNVKNPLENSKIYQKIQSLKASYVR